MIDENTSVDNDLNECSAYIKKHSEWVNSEEYKNQNEQNRIMDLLSGNIHYKKIEDKDVDKLVFGFLATPLYFYEIEDLKGREELGYFDFFENVKKITNLILSCEFSNGYSGDFGGLSREEYWGAFASTVERPDAIIFIEKGCGVKMANNDNKYDQAKGLLLEITSYLCEEFGGWFDLDKKYFELSGYHF